MKLSRQVVCVAFGICCALVSSMVSAQQTWNPVGSTDMRWAVFKLYNITLLTSSGKYQPDDYPQALEIRYYRNIDKEDLVRATDDQWAKLGIPSDKRELWLPELLAMWPDIKANDRLRIEVDDKGANTFFYNDQQIGGVDNKEFSQAFLDIWLSPETSRPDLRKKLIGGRPENV